MNMGYFLGCVRLVRGILELSKDRPFNGYYEQPKPKPERDVPNKTVEDRAGGTVTAALFALVLFILGRLYLCF